MPELKNSTLDDIASVIGFAATVRLAAHYGDRDLHVPLEVSDLHPVAKLIGVSRLNRLCSEWAGERLSVPSLSFLSVEIRNAKVLTNLLKDISVEKTATEFGLSKRRVEQLRGEFAREGLLPNFTPRKS